MDTSINGSGHDGHDTPNNSSSHSQQELNNHGSVSGGLFFADATLDLDEAHDIAETPEPPRRFLSVDSQNSSTQAKLRLPQLMDSAGGNGNGSISRNNSAANSRSVSPQTNPNVAAAAAPSSSTSLEVDPEGPPSSKSLSGPMNRITSGHNGNNHDYSLGGGSGGGGGSSRMGMPGRHRSRARPRWPRDLPWAVAFCVVVPMGLLWPSLMWHRQNIFGTASYTTTPLALPVLRHATFWSIVLTYACALLLARGLYRTVGGGEGDDL